MNHTTRKFPRTSREAFGLSPDEANPIQVFHQPLLQRLFFGFVRHGWILFVLALAVLVLSGCSDMQAEEATAASVADAIADAGKTGVQQ